MRRVVRVVLLMALLSAGIVLPGPAAQACDCGVPVGQTAIDQAGAVFEGTIVSRQVRGKMPGPVVASAGNVDYRIDVQWVFKGDVDAEVHVVADSSSAACGAVFPKSGRILVYADDSYPAADAAHFSTNGCQPTQMVHSPQTMPTEYAQAERPVGYEAPVERPNVTPSDDYQQRSFLTAGETVVLGAAFGVLLLALAAGVFWWLRRPD